MQPNYEIETDLDGELQNYLDVKGVNAMFVKIVENLLVEKPDNPAFFMMEFLKRCYILRFEILLLYYLPP